MYKCSNSCLWCSCWWNLDFSFKSYGKESLYKYCMNVDDGCIMRSWRSCLFFVGGRMSYLRYLCLFANSGVQHILCCVFLPPVYPMLPMFLDYPVLIAPSVFSNVYLGTVILINSVLASWNSTYKWLITAKYIKMIN